MLCGESMLHHHHLSNILVVSMQHYHMFQVELML